MKNKGISIPLGIVEFISLLIAFGIIILIVRFVFGNVINLKIEKDEFEGLGKSVNLANAVLMSKQIASLDESGQPKKGILDKTKLEVLNQANKPLDCCDYIEYDYSITIKGTKEYQIGYNKNYLNELLNLGKKCKAEFDSAGVKTYKFPVVIEDSYRKYSASAYIALSQTPISKISKEVSASCLKDFYEKEIPVYGFNKNGFVINKNMDFYEICISTYKDVQMCKKISCAKDIKIKIIDDKCKDIDDKCGEGCSYFFDKDCKTNTCSYGKIISDENEVIICFSSQEKDLEKC